MKLEGNAKSMYAMSYIERTCRCGISLNFQLNSRHSSSKLSRKSKTDEPNVSYCCIRNSQCLHPKRSAKREGKNGDSLAREKLLFPFQATKLVINSDASLNFIRTLDLKVIARTLTEPWERILVQIRQWTRHQHRCSQRRGQRSAIKHRKLPCECSKHLNWVEKFGIECNDTWQDIENRPDYIRCRVQGASFSNRKLFRTVPSPYLLFALFLLYFFWFYIYELTDFVDEISFLNTCLIQLRQQRSHNDCTSFGNQDEMR